MAMTGRVNRHIIYNTREGSDIWGSALTSPYKENEAQSGEGGDLADSGKKGE